MDSMYADYLSTLFQTQFSKPRPKFMVQSNLNNLMIYESASQLIMGWIDIFLQKDKHEIELMTNIIKKQDYSLVSFSNKIVFQSRREMNDNEIQKISIQIQKNPANLSLYLIKFAYRINKKVYSYLGLLFFCSSLEDWSLRSNRTIRLSSILKHDIERGKILWINSHRFYLLHQNAIKGFQLLKVQPVAWHHFSIENSIQTAKCCDYSCFNIWGDTIIICILDKSGLIYCLLPTKQQTTPSYKQQLLLNKYQSSLIKPGMHLLSLLFTPSSLDGQYKKLRIYQHIYQQCQFTIVTLYKRIDRQSHHQIILQFYFLSLNILDFKLIQILKIVEEISQSDKVKIQFLFNKLINQKLYIRYNQTLKCINFQPFFQYFISESQTSSFPCQVDMIDQNIIEKDDKIRQIVEYDDKIYVVRQKVKESQMHIDVLSSQVGQNEDFNDQKIKFMAKVFVENPIKNCSIPSASNSSIQYPELKYLNESIKSYNALAQHQKVSDSIKKKYIQLEALEKKLNAHGRKSFELSFAQKTRQYEQLKKEVANNDDEIRRLCLQSEQIKRSTVYRDYMKHHFEYQHNKLQFLQQFPRQESSPQSSNIVRKLQQLTKQCVEIKNNGNKIPSTQLKLF